jgi:hypothetical protein
MFAEHFTQVCHAVHHVRDAHNSTEPSLGLALCNIITLTSNSYNSLVQRKPAPLPSTSAHVNALFQASISYPHPPDCLMTMLFSLIR